MSTYFAILTDRGEAKLANAQALGTQVQYSHMAVGDGNGNLPVPDRLQPALVREQYRAGLNELKPDPLNASQIIAELVIPENVGGWWIREMGLYDADGDLVAVANCPPSYKPLLAEGSGRTQVLRMVLIVSSTAAVQLKIDPTVVLATRAYADSLIAVHMLSVDPHPQYKTEVATQPEAEAGANNVKRMTPLRVKQAIEKLVPASTDGIAGSFANLKVSATGTNATVQVAADSVCVKNAAGQQKVLNGVALAINSAIVGANGLDTDVLAANTWYSKWVIYNPTTQAVAGLLSLSATAPTMPAGFTHRARIGWIRTDNTANKFPLSFTQSGRNVQYKVVAGSNVEKLPTAIAGVQGSLTAPTWVSASLTALVPPSANAVVICLHGQGSGIVMAAPNSSYGASSSTTNPAPANFNTAQNAASGTHMYRFELESTNVFFASNFAGAGLSVFGWEDNV